MMRLPGADEEYLQRLGYRYDFLPPAGAGGDSPLVLRGVVLAPGKFDQSNTDVLVKVPAGYPVAGLDMFWVAPTLHCANGSLPPAADQLNEQHENRTWQRFSRHLGGGGWRPGVDSLRTFLPLVFAELTLP